MTEFRDVAKQHWRLCQSYDGGMVVELLVHDFHAFIFASGCEEVSDEMWCGGQGSGLPFLLLGDNTFLNFLPFFGAAKHEAV